MLIRRGARDLPINKIKQTSRKTKAKSKIKTKQERKQIMVQCKNILKRFWKICPCPTRATKQHMKTSLRQRRLRSQDRARRFRRLWFSSSKLRCSRTCSIAWWWALQLGQILLWAVCSSNRCSSSSNSTGQKPLARTGPWLSFKLRFKPRQQQRWQWASVAWIQTPILSLQDLVRLHLSISIIISWQTEMMTKSTYPMKNSRKAYQIRRDESSMLWWFQLIKLIWFDRKSSKRGEWNTYKRCRLVTNILRKLRRTMPPCKPEQWAATKTNY